MFHDSIFGSYAFIHQQHTIDKNIDAENKYKRLSKEIKKSDLTNFRKFKNIGIKRK